MYERDIASMKAQVERSLKKGYDTGYDSGLEKGIQSLIETYRYEFNIPKNVITKK